MKTFILAVVSATLMVLTCAQNLPSCALSCATIGTASTGCRPNDANCICHGSNYLDSLMSCVKSSCSEADQEATMEGAISFCMQPGIQNPASTVVDTAVNKGAVATTTSSRSSASAATMTKSMVTSTTVASSTGSAASGTKAAAAAQTGAASFVGPELGVVALAGFAGLLL